MEGSNKTFADNEIVALREGIKNRYQSYHAHNRVKYPLFEYNTNRANYEPMKESFEEEFFLQRGIDRQRKTIHIPSTTTLALLFTDDSYVPSQKISNTCWSYAEGQAKAAATPTEVTPKPPQPVSVQNYNWLLLGGVGLLIGLLIGVMGSRYLLLPASKKLELTAQNSTVPRDLKIDMPTSKSRVPPTFVVNGQASPGEVVWLVTRLHGTDYYWVQYPALVDHRGLWLQAIGISGGGFDKEGKTHQLRAFVNPTNELRVSDVLRSWPKAERSTDIIDVVMDPKATRGD